MLVEFRFHFDGARKEHFVLKVNMLLEISFKFVESGKQSNVCSTGPLRWLKAMGKATEFSDEVIGGLMLLHHLCDRMNNRTEARMARRIGDD